MRRTAGKRMRVGAIDIGSNSIRMLVAEVPRSGSAGRLSTVARAGEPCRLARGLGRTGEVDPEIAERAATLVGEFARRAHSLGAGHIVVGATAALRQATNGAEIAALIGERIGIPVRILTGEEEARLVYQAVLSGLGAGPRRNACVVFDLGGGSTEIVSGIGLEVGRWVSLPFGAVSLTERFVKSDPADASEMDRIKAHVDGLLMHECAYMPDAAPVLAGVGGTVTVLASLDRGLSAYDPTQIEGWTIKPDRLGALIARVTGSTRAERGEWTLLGTGRGDIVVAGALVIGCLASRFHSGGLVCSTHGLRYGLAWLAATESGPGPNPPARKDGANFPG